jgi:hypothetical protein
MSPNSLNVEHGEQQAQAQEIADLRQALAFVVQQGKLPKVELTLMLSRAFRDLKEFSVQVDHGLRTFNMCLRLKADLEISFEQIRYAISEPTAQVNTYLMNLLERASQDNLETFSQPGLSTQHDETSPIDLTGSSSQPTPRTYSSLDLTGDPGPSAPGYHSSVDLTGVPGPSAPGYHSSIDLTWDCGQSAPGYYSSVDLTDEGGPWVPGCYPSVDLTGDPGPSAPTYHSSIDLTRDPRPGAKARLAALEAAESAQSRENIDTSDAQPSSADVPSTPGRLAEAPERLTEAPGRLTETPAPETGNPDNPRGKNASEFVTPSTNSQTLATNNRPEGRQSTIGPSRTSSRASGPSDTIQGMRPGSGVDRLLLMQRSGLPRGNVNGITYSCEAQCGYADSAANMISCDSAFHRRQKKIKLPDGDLAARGWYHRPCVDLPEDETPNVWFCPTCISNNQTSMDDNDYDDGDGDGDDGSGPGSDEDSEDEYQPGNGTPDEESEGNDGEDEAQDDSDSTENKKGGNKRSTNNKSTKRHVLRGDDDGEKTDEKRGRGKSIINQTIPKQYILDSDDDGDDDDDDNEDDDEDDDDGKDDAQGNGEGRSQGLDHNQEEQAGGGLGTASIQDADTDNQSVKPPSRAKSNGKKKDKGKGKEKKRLWIDAERVDCIKHMCDIRDEGVLKGETRFVEVARRMQLAGFDREWTGVKNVWNRGLREKSGFDERKNKNAPLTTSKQDSATKEKNKKLREMKAQGQISTSTSKPRTTKSLSPKREHESDEEEEVMPIKRRRSSPFNADRFHGIP